MDALETRLDGHALTGMHVHAPQDSSWAGDDFSILVGLEEQRKLKAASVLIVGAGGIGSAGLNTPVLKATPITSAPGNISPSLAL